MATKKPPHYGKGGRPPGEMNCECCICGRKMHRRPCVLKVVKNTTCGDACRAEFVARRRAGRILNTHCQQCGAVLNHKTKHGKIQRNKRFCSGTCASRWARNDPASRAKWAASREAGIVARREAARIAAQYTPRPGRTWHEVDHVCDPYMAVYD
jgi:hypothetical protein